MSEKAEREIRTENQTGPEARPKRKQWLEKREKQLKILRAVIVGVLVLTLLSVLMLLIFPLFRVNEILVEGNRNTSAEEIIHASGVKVGDELFGINLQKIANSIQKNCPVTVTVSVTPGKLKIAVIEREAYYIAFADRYFSFDNNLNVVATDLSEDAFQGLIKAVLPDISVLQVGQPAQFADRETDRSYIAKLLDFFEEQELTGRVTRMDVSKKFEVSFVLDGTLQIKVGSVSGLEEKLQLVRRILGEKGDADPYKTVDVSDPGKTLYRPEPDGNFGN